MNSSFYTATITPFIQTLRSLDRLLDKAEAWCRERGAPDTVLTEARLADDMWPFAKQVTAAIQHSAGAVRALQSGQATPDLSEAPTDFPSLRARIVEALAELEKVTAAGLDGAAERDVCFRMGRRSLDFEAPGFLFTFALPNFYFHVTTAYAILRNQGVPIGKGDFLGAPQLKAKAG